MICRLCLNNLYDENCIPLFDIKENNGESTMVKMIAKYLYLEITQSDTLSTQICKKCYQHLDDFHNFCTNVEQQQSTLHNEFFEIACDVKIDSGEANGDEALLDLQDILADQNSTISMKLETDESSVEPLDRDFDEAGSNEDDIPLKYLRKRKKTNVLLETKADSKDSLSIQKSKTTTKINKTMLPKKIKSKTTKSKSKKMGEKTIQKTVKRKQPPKISPEESDEMHRFITKYMQMKCHMCEKSFEKFTDVRPHFKHDHIGVRPSIMCCESRFLTQKYLYEHVHWHLNPAYFKCEHCEKVFKNRHCLNLHIVDQHEKNEESCLRCPHCTKTFSRPTVFNQHVKTHTAERIFACELCDKSFMIKQHLDKHIQSIHKNIYPHICDFCGKKFKWKISFEKHVLEHQGVVEPPVQCKICGEFYKNKRLLHHHMDHHNTKDVKCKYCGHESPTAGALRGHIYYAHRLQMKHQCTYCDKVFKKKKNLQEHVATHTGQNLYNCQHCFKEFRSNANMYVHIKRQHPQEWSAAQLKRSRSGSTFHEEIEKKSI